MSSYRPDIDGMRAIAVVSVVAFHTFPKVVPGGFTGVDVFFVISGFLISSIILDEIENQAFSLRRFYERRIRRIFPALSLVLLASLLVGWIVLLPDEYRALAEHVLAAAVFVSNILSWSEAGYFDVAAVRKPLLHLWSLGVEEQFYLLWPCCLLLVHRKRWAALAVAALASVSFTANVLLGPAHRSAVFYWPFTRLWELLLGYAALKFTRSRYSEQRASINSACAAAGLSLVIGSAFLISGAAEYPSWRGLFPTFGAALLIMAGGNVWINRRVLSSRPLVLIGLMSYPLYLWHWPLLSFAAILTRPGAELKLALVAASFLLAWLTWRYVEAGIRRSRNPHAASRLAAALAAIALCAGLVFAARGAEFRPAYKNSRAAIQDVSSHLQGVECEFPHADLNLCRQSKPGRVDAVVIGDSHGEALFQGLASDPNRNWLVLGNTSCAPVLAVAFEITAGAYRPDCTEKMLRIENYLRDPSSPQIVVLAFYGYYAETTAVAADHVDSGLGPPATTIESDPPQTKQQAFALGLSNMIKVALRPGRAVYLTIDVPELPFYPRDCIRKAATGIGDCVVPRKSIDLRQSGLRNIVSGLAAKWPAVRIFDPLPMVCGAGDCVPVRTNFSFYMDSHHLSMRGSQVVDRSLLALIDATQAPTSPHAPASPHTRPDGESHFGPALR
jgi:peptidoglycan/LPS O-acetylase OafA/YrhL